ncbi:MAG: hypothetical protein Q4E28_03580 [Clostridia bacterium]|nr:hypothetical protein [Clostridia bacterium]
MNKRRTGISPGSASLIMVFTIFCLTIFAALTFINAKREADISKINIQNTKNYYQADLKATEKISSMTETGPEILTVREKIDDKSELVVVAQKVNGEYKIIKHKTVMTNKWEPQEVTEFAGGQQ